MSCIRHFDSGDCVFGHDVRVWQIKYGFIQIGVRGKALVALGHVTHVRGIGRWSVCVAFESIFRRRFISSENSVEWSEHLWTYGWIAWFMCSFLLLTHVVCYEIVSNIRTTSRVFLPFPKCSILTRRTNTQTRRRQQFFSMLAHTQTLE